MLIIDKTPLIDVQGQAQSSKDGHRSGSAIAQQGKGNANGRHDSESHSYIDGNMEEHETCHTRTDQDSDAITGGFGNSNQAHQNEQIKHQDQYGTDKSDLFGQDGKDKIGVNLGNKSQLALQSLSQSLAKQAS